MAFLDPCRRGRCKVILAEETLDLSEASPVLMRFVCDSCRAQYMISDEKVGPRGVKVRCKKCGHVIHVRRPDTGGEGAVAAPQESEAAAAAQSETPTAENNIFSGVDEDEIGAAFDQALKGEGTHVTNPFQPPEEDSDSTRVMDEESVKRFAEMSQGGTPTPVPPPPPSPPPAPGVPAPPFPPLIAPLLVSVVIVLVLRTPRAPWPS